MKLSASKDEYGLREIQDDDTLFILPEHTKVRVIDIRLVKTEIRVMESNLENMDLWIASEFVNQ